jgi:hypothetical protein
VLTLEPSRSSPLVSSAINNSSDAQTPLGLEYDVEWLAVLRKTHALLSCSQSRVTMPELFSVPSKEVFLALIYV